MPEGLISRPYILATVETLPVPDVTFPKLLEEDEEDGFYSPLFNITARSVNLRLATIILAHANHPIRRIPTSR
jgi:hypothetical protein